MLVFLIALLGGGPRMAHAQQLGADSVQVRRVSPMLSPLPYVSERALGPIRLDTVQARRFDNGKMWTFDAPPVEYFREAYDFAPDSAWFARARLGTLRLPNCTASFASPHGLVLTNHHCGRDHATAVGQSGEDILENGFYASGLEAERPVPGLYVDQLVAIRDVTERIEGAVADAETAAERAEARRAAIERIQEEIAAERGGEAAGVHVEVIPLYNGARYSAYVFRRYDDVRLVMIPELQLGYFGGDPDNFTYPRYALDMALFRVYEDGAPLETEHYFPWSEEGADAGDPVFVVGNPGSTLRLETVPQLQFRRDVQEPAVLAFLESRTAALEAYAEAEEEGPSDALQNEIFGLRNAMKLYRGRVQALEDPYLIARRRDDQQAFLDSIEATPALRSAYGGLVDSMAAIQKQKRAYADAHRAFLLTDNPNYSSATLRRALLARQYVNRRAEGASGAPLDALREQLQGVADQPAGIDRRFLEARLRDLQTYFGENHAVVREALQGQSPEEAAAAIVETSVLADSAETAAVLAADTLSAEDPALRLVEARWPRLQEYQSAWAGLGAREQEVARRLGQARFELYGTRIPPDATFSLRLADGVVKGYPYNGTEAPPRTTFYGLYAHYAAHGPGSAWDLPERWLEPPGTFDRATPLNLVSTNDITGGNSGSPLLNQNLEVVGLVFDGNIESLAGTYIYMPDRGMRAVSVDVRGMLEALDEIYDADRLVLEVTEGAFVETESAADAAASDVP